MEKNKKEELISRRSFFKRGISRVLPVLVCATIPTFVASCSSDEPTCSECADSCNANCSSGCYTSCDSSSKSSICSSCASNCEGSSTSTTCSSCANDCTGNCNNSCGTSCGNNCSSSCKDTSTNSGSNNDKNVSDASGKIDGYEYVDLGLSVKWARYNIGTNKPEGYGTYLTHNTANTYVDLWQENIWGYDQSISGTKFDMASSKWGNKWKMPTRDEWNELINNCNVTNITYNSCNGLLFTSKKNGKSIFFAFAGHMWRLSSGEWEYFGAGEYGYYWSGDISNISKYTEEAYYMGMWVNGTIYTIIHEGNMWDDKFTIRPVSNDGGSSSGCSGSCTAVCANNATGGCSGCSSNCSGGCKTKCDYNCAGTCISHCYGSCNDTCGGTCKYVSAGTKCSGCATTCNGRCYRACSYACSSNCESSCVHGSK